MRRLALALLLSPAFGCRPAGPSPAPQPTSAGATSTADVAPPSPEAETPEQVVRAVVAALEAGDAASVVARFSDAVKAELSESAVAGMWPTIVAQAGALRAVEDVRSERDAEGLDMVRATLALERAKLEMRMRLDAERRIVAWSIRSAEVPYAPPAYVDPASFEERELEVTSPLAMCGGECQVLPATLSLPKAAGQVPGVVLVHGSGPQDRDETIGPNRPFRDIAWGLASRGIAVLRYVKRTKQYGARLRADEVEKMTLAEETIVDALAAARLLRATAGVDPRRVYVLGHSLGGFALPRIAKADPALAGFVTLAGSTRPLEDLVENQLRYIAELDGQLSDAENAELAKLAEQVARVKRVRPGVDTAASDLPLGIPAAYWLDLAAHRVEPLLAGERRPFLVLQGDRDYQVTGADFDGWQRALARDKAAKFVLYPDLDHIFAPVDGPGTPSDYEKLRHVAPQVIADIADFLGEPSR